jgi:hypothetical protein
MATMAVAHVYPSLGARWSGTVVDIDRPCSQISGAIYEWGDGSGIDQTSWTAAPAAGDTGSCALAGSHTWTANGSYAFTADVFTKGNQGTGTLASDFADVYAATLEVPSLTLTAASPYSGPIATVQPATPIFGPLSLLPRVDWGDGTTTPATLGPTSIAANHTYAAPGVYTMRVAIENQDDSKTYASATGTVTVLAPGAVGVGLSSTATPNTTVVCGTQLGTGTLAPRTYAAAPRAARDPDTVRVGGPLVVLRFATGCAGGAQHVAVQPTGALAVHAVARTHGGNVLAVSLWPAHAGTATVTAALGHGRTARITVRVLPVA